MSFGNADLCVHVRKNTDLMKTHLLAYAYVDIIIPSKRKKS